MLNEYTLFEMYKLLQPIVKVLRDLSEVILLAEKPKRHDSKKLSIGVREYILRKIFLK